MHFGERLRELRDRAGLTQDQLAERSGINLWTIRGYEQGRREPNWKGALTLAAALGVTAEAFADCEEVGKADDAPIRPRGRPKKAPPNAVDKPAKGKKGKK